MRIGEEHPTRPEAPLQHRRFTEKNTWIEIDLVIPFQESPVYSGRLSLKDVEVRDEKIVLRLVIGADNLDRLGLEDLELGGPPDLERDLIGEAAPEGVVDAPTDTNGAAAVREPFGQGLTRHRK